MRPSCHSAVLVAEEGEPAGDEGGGQEGFPGRAAAQLAGADHPEQRRTVQCVTQDYLRLVADSPPRNYLGLLLPLSQGCQPCTVRYDAVIRMETFVQDSR